MAHVKDAARLEVCIVRKKQLESIILESKAIMAELLDSLELARTLIVKLEGENAMLERSILFAIHATDDGLPNIAHSQLKYAQTQINGWKE